MIHLIDQVVTFTTAQTTERDIRSLEDNVNQFTQKPEITVSRQEFQVYTEGANTHAMVMLEYSLKPR